MKAKKEAGRKRPGAFLLYLTKDQRTRLEAYRAKLEQVRFPLRVSKADVVRIALEQLFASPDASPDEARPEAEGRLALEVPPSLLAATATKGSLDGASLKAAREMAGESQAVFAKRLGVSQPSLSAWESGKRAVPAERVEGLRRILGM